MTADGRLVALVGSEVQVWPLGGEPSIVAHQPEALGWLRADVSGRGAVAVVAQGQSGQGWLWAGGVWRPIGHTFGISPVDIVKDGLGWQVWMQTAADRYDVLTLGVDGAVIALVGHAMTPTSQGFLDASDPSLLRTDDARQIGGLMLPNRCGPYLCGQDPQAERMLLGDAHGQPERVLASGAPCWEPRAAWVGELVVAYSRSDAGGGVVAIGRPAEFPKWTPLDPPTQPPQPPEDDMAAARPVWHPVGTVVDTLPFLVPDYAGTLRCPADGQTLQTVRTGPREVCCLKGAPDRQERWRWDDQAVYLTYDATDGREGRPWRVSPEPIWCRRVSFVGDRQAYRDTVLVRRTLAGGSTREAFPVRTSVYAYGEHIPIPGIGRCRILTTTWEPHAPESQYQERHWWAIREGDGLRLGRVRYEEWRRGGLARSFDFTELRPDELLVPAPPLAIPDPAPEPSPEPDPMPDVQFPPRDETLAFLAQLEARYRDDLQRPSRETHVDAEGTAVWLESYLRYRVQGRAHAAAVAAVMTDIDRVLGIGPPPPANGLVGALRVE